MTTPPKIEKVETVAKSRVFQVERLDLEFSNGAKAQFERLTGKGRGGVMIVAIDRRPDDSTGDALLLIREWAAGTESYELGFAKGLVEHGETVLDAAGREIQEELGVAANSLALIRELSPSPAYMRFRTYLVFAEQLHDSRLPGDEPEPLEVVRWPLSNAEALLDHPEFNDARAIAALLLLLRQESFDTQTP